MRSVRRRTSSVGPSSGSINRSDIERARRNAMQLNKNVLEKMILLDVMSDLGEEGQGQRLR